MNNSSKITPKTRNETKDAFAHMLDILHHLRSPEGCPWDQKQTLESIRANMLEEPAELVEAIHEYIDSPSKESAFNLREEFGDVLLVVCMMIIIYEDDEKDALTTLLNELSEKLIRRHPHVFNKNENSAKNNAELSEQWQKIKTEQEGKKNTFSSLSLETFHPMLDTLERTKKIQKNIERANKHKNSSSFVQNKTTSQGLTAELTDLAKEIAQLNDTDKGLESSKEQLNYAAEDLIGNILYKSVALARHYKISPTAALLKKTREHIKNNA